MKSGGLLVQTTERNAPVKTYYGVTMQDLAEFLTVMAGRTPVRDRTGLMGRYDFRIQQIQLLSDTENHVYSYPVQHLGLQIRRGTEARPVLVIDHIERPASN